MRGGGEGSRIVANKGHLFWEFFVEPRHRDDSRIFSSDVTGMTRIENEQLSSAVMEIRSNQVY